MQICPWCEKPLEVVVRQPGGVSKQNRTRREYLFGLASNLFKPRRYSQSIAPAVGQPQVIHAAPEPQSNINTIELQRGETRECTRYRQKTIHDLVPSFVWSAVFGAGSGAVAWAAGGSTQVIVGVGSGLTVVAFLIVSIPIVWIGHANVVTMKEILTRTDGDEGTSEGDINVEHKRRQGSTTHWRFPQIPTPKAGREMLARWFWRIYRRQGVGFSQNVGQSYHIGRGEVKAIQDVFVAEEWATRDDDGGATPNPEGLDVMAEVVDEIFPTAHLSPDAA